MYFLMHTITHPEPDPPTIATFLPAGIVKDRSLKMGFPGT